MPIASDINAPAPKPPRKPRKPKGTGNITPVPPKVTPQVTRLKPATVSPYRRPIGPSEPNFVPTARLDTSRINDQPAPRFPVGYRSNSPSKDILPFTGQTEPQSNGFDLGYKPSYASNFGSPSLEVPRANPTESPSGPGTTYSNYAAGLQGQPYSNYAQALADQNAYNIDSDTPNNPDRQPSQILTDKEIQRKIARRGGFGLYGARSPIQGFDFNADRNTFGPSVDPIHGGMRNHTGEDMGAAAGTPIYAPTGGVVSTATPNGGAYGNQIILDHGAGEESMYGHLSGMTVAPGQKVKRGDLIGYVGSTGRSTGPHLHWETWKDGQQLDPNTLFGRGGPPPEVLEAALQKFGGQQAPQQGPVQQQVPNELAPNNGLNALMQAIREQESGGDYDVQNGIGAMGAFQVMPANIEGEGGWDLEALNQEITGEEFLNSPTLQNQIARFKLRDYFKKYGAGGAAKAWYAGPGNANLDSNGPQYGGPSVNSYAENVLELMRKYMGT